MIAEPGILSTSPWNSDLLLKDLQSELFRPYLSISDAFDMGFQLMDTDNNDAWTRSCRGESKYDAGGSSCTPSSASSECSDELNFDIAWPTSSSATTAVTSSSDNNVFQLADHDYLNTSLSLLDNNLEVCPSDCDFDWVAGEDLVVSTVYDDGVLSREDMSTPLSNGGSKGRRSRSFADAVGSNKLWSKMKIQEQLEAVEALTNIVSNELGLREQLDVIRIIEPSAIVSPTDKEFVIDLNCLNDQKLGKVREYVRRIQSTESSTQQQVRPNKNDKSKTAATTTAAAAAAAAMTSSNRPINRIEQGSSSTTTTRLASASSPSRGKHSKKEAKEKRPPQKVFKQRQKKEYKQLMKERRSGLFEHEEVLSLKTAEIIEDDDIDILG